MTKFLRQITKEIGGRRYLSKGDEDFVAQHVIQQFDDPNGNGDEVFKGVINPFERAKYRHGYNPGQDVDAYNKSNKGSVAGYLDKKMSSRKKLRADRQRYNTDGSDTVDYAHYIPDGKIIDEGLKLLKTHTDGIHSAKVYRNNDWEEYHVKFYKDGKHLSKADYHTDDKDDAHDTAKYHLKLNAGKSPIKESKSMDDLTDKQWAKIHGHRAGNEKRPSHHNPYKKGSEEHSIWYKSWKAAYEGGQYKLKESRNAGLGIESAIARWLLKKAKNHFASKPTKTATKVKPKTEKSPVKHLKAKTTVKAKTKTVTKPPVEVGDKTDHKAQAARFHELSNKAVDPKRKQYYADMKAFHLSKLNEATMPLNRALSKKGKEFGFSVKSGINTRSGYIDSPSNTRNYHSFKISQWIDSNNRKNIVKQHFPKHDGNGGNAIIYAIKNNDNKYDSLINHPSFPEDHKNYLTYVKSKLNEELNEKETSSSTCKQRAGKRYTQRHGEWFDGYLKEDLSEGKISKFFSRPSRAKKLKDKIDKSVDKLDNKLDDQTLSIGKIMRKHYDNKISGIPETAIKTSQDIYNTKRLLHSIGKKKSMIGKFGINKWKIHPDDDPYHLGGVKNPKYLSGKNRLKESYSDKYHLPITINYQRAANKSPEIVKIKVHDHVKDDGKHIHPEYVKRELKRQHGISVNNYKSMIKQIEYPNKVQTN